MLSEQKYGALVNNFSTAVAVMQELQSQGAMDFVCNDMQQRDERQGTTEVLGDKLSSVNIPFSTSETQEEAVRPRLSPNIKCFVFPKGDISRFKPARWATREKYFTIVI